MHSLGFVASKVYWPYMVTLFHQTPIFEWYGTWLVVKNRHQNDTCYNEIGLCVQNVDIIQVH